MANIFQQFSNSKLKKYLDASFSKTPKTTTLREGPRVNYQAAANYFRPKTGTLATKGRNAWNRLASRPIGPTAQKFVSGVNKLYNTKNPLISVPLQFQSGHTTGGNLGLTRNMARDPETGLEKAAYAAGSITSVLNPYTLSGKSIKLFNKVTNPVLAKIVSPTVAKPIIGRVSSGLANLAQGELMSQTLYGQKQTSLERALDFGIGLALGPTQFDDVNVKSLYQGKEGKQFVFKPKKLMTGEDIKILDRITDNYNQIGAIKRIDKKYLRNVLKSVSKTSDDVLDKMSETKLINEVIRHANLSASSEGKIAGQFTKMGITGDQKINIRKPIKEVEPYPWETKVGGRPEPKVKTKVKPIEGVADKDSFGRAELLIDNGDKNIWDNVKSFFKLDRTGKWEDGLKKQWGDFVNKRRTVGLDRYITEKTYSQYQDVGVDEWIKIQKGKGGKEYKAAKQYFDDSYKYITDELGIKMRRQENYVPQLWKNSKEEIDSVFGKTISDKAPFTFEKIIDNYQKGLKKGLTPKFDNLAQIMGWYEGQKMKLSANKKFLDYLGEEGLLVPKNKAPRNWISLDMDRLPNQSIKIGNKIYSGELKAPKELTEVINDYLKAGEGTLSTMASYVSNVKNRVLTGGIPGTGINFHGFNILRRYITASDNPIKGFLTGVNYMVRPNAALKHIDDNLTKANMYAKAGMSIDINDKEFKKIIAPEIVNKIRKFGFEYDKLFSDPLFRKMIPAMKIDIADTIYNDMIKQGMKHDEAVKLAAHQANTFFGGINWDEMGRSPQMQNILRSTLLAPDWLESNLRLGKETANSILNQLARLVGYIEKE